jgi:hypothetical protein
MKRLLIWWLAVAAYVPKLFLFPATFFFRYQTVRASPHLLFCVVYICLLSLGIIFPALWPTYLLAFAGCLSFSLLHHKIYQEQRAIIEGLKQEDNSLCLVYAPLLRLPFLICNYTVLLVSLILLLRQVAQLWGSAIFDPPTQSMTAWLLYAADLILKATLFDIPEIYHLDLVAIEHVGFWGATLVFVSRLVILVLLLGSLLRWREVYQMVAAAVGVLAYNREMAEPRLLLILRMFPGQIKKLCRLCQDTRLHHLQRTGLLEIMGKSKNMAVLPTLEKMLGERAHEEIRLAALRALAFLGAGPLAAIRSLFSADNTVAIKQQACHTLALWPPPDNISTLANIAQSREDTKVRLSAIQALGNIKHEEAIAPLLLIMENGQTGKEERFAAKDSLIRIGFLPAKIRQLLCNSLQLSPYADNRRFAAMVLGGIADDDSLGLLVSRVDSEQDADAQTHILRAIGNIACVSEHKREPISVQLAMWRQIFSTVKGKAANSSEPFVRVAAIQTLLDMAWLLTVPDSGVVAGDFSECLERMAAEKNTQVADAANEGLARLSHYTQDIQFQQRRECITAVGIQDLSWRKNWCVQENSAATFNQNPSSSAIYNPADEVKQWRITTVYPYATSSQQEETMPSRVDIPKETNSVETSDKVSLVASDNTNVSGNFPASLSRYRPLSRLSRGKVFVVYHVWDNLENKEKVLKYLSIPQEWACQLFQREVEALTACRHPGIVPMLEKYETAYAFTMPWFALPNLYQVANQKKSQRLIWSKDEAAAVIGSLCQVVDAIHQAGWCHGDIKPENILYSPERVMLLDFSTAYRLAGQQTSATSPMSGGGTPYYMAPEQAHQNYCDQRTDIYAIGVLTYEMLTGVLPMGIAPMSVAVARSDISGRVQDVLTRATAFSLQERFATVQQFWHALERAFAEQGENRP